MYNTLNSVKISTSLPPVNSYMLYNIFSTLWTVIKGAVVYTMSQQLQGTELDTLK